MLNCDYYLWDIYETYEKKGHNRDNGDMGVIHSDGDIMGTIGTFAMPRWNSRKRLTGEH